MIARKQNLRVLGWFGNRRPVRNGNGCWPALHDGMVLRPRDHARDHPLRRGIAPDGDRYDSLTMLARDLDRFSPSALVGIGAEQKHAVGMLPILGRQVCQAAERAVALARALLFEMLLERPDRLLERLVQRWYDKKHLQCGIVRTVRRPDSLSATPADLRKRRYADRRMGGVSEIASTSSLHNVPEPVA